MTDRQHRRALVLAWVALVAGSIASVALTALLISGGTP